MQSLARHAAGILARKGLLARTVVLKLRYFNFETITRSQTRPPTASVEEIAARASELLEKTEAGPRPVRLLGVSLHGLCEDSDDSPELPGRVDQLDLPVETHGPRSGEQEEAI